MRRRLFAYLFFLTAFFLSGFEGRAMEVTASKENEPVVMLAPEATLQQREADFVLKGIDRSGRKTATLDKDGKVQVWDTSRGVLLKTLRGDYKNEQVWHLTFSPNGHILIIETPLMIVRTNVERPFELEPKSETQASP